MLIDFRKTGRERERNIDVREKRQAGAPHTSPDGGQTHNLGSALTRDQTHSPVGVLDGPPPN